MKFFYRKLTKENIKTDINYGSILSLCKKINFIDFCIITNIDIVDTVKINLKINNKKYYFEKKPIQGLPGFFEYMNNINKKDFKSFVFTHPYECVNMYININTNINTDMLINAYVIMIYDYEKKNNI